MRHHTAEMNKDVRAIVESGKESGTWDEFFGVAAEEIFLTYSVASYIEYVASEGKNEYDLPMMVDAWLDKGQEAGMFSSGESAAHMMEVWKYCAPHIDVLAPDIYVQDFCDEYIKLDNPLVIPETATHGHAGPRLVYVVGHYHAFGISPFGFEDMEPPFTAMNSCLFGVDVSDPLRVTQQDEGEYAWYNRTLGSMMRLLTSKYGTKDLQVVISERPKQDTMILEQYGFKVMMGAPMITRKDGVCLALKVAEDEFYLIAKDCMVAAFSADPEKPNVDVLALEGGEIRERKWHMRRG